MMQYSVYNVTTEEGETFYSLSAAKKRMKELMKQGFEVEGSRTKIWSNGDWEPCGSITLSGSNKTLVVNTRQTKPNY